MNSNSNSILNLEFIIGLLFVLTLYRCMNTSNERKKPYNSPSSTENCVKILHPVWVEGFLYEEELNRNNKFYRGAVLKGFIKNMCLDTIVIHLNYSGLHVGVADYF